MSLNILGSRPEPLWRPDITGRLESSRRLRDLERTGGLKFEAVDFSRLFNVQSQVGNSCLGFSRAQCLWLWLAINGFVPESFPDAYRPYWYARVIHREQHQDKGTYTSTIWSAGGRWGDVAWDPSRSEIAELQGPPPAKDALRAVDVKVDARPIYDSGDRLVWRICDSLTKGQPVQISMKVSRDFAGASGARVEDIPLKAMSLGHAMTVIGCRESTTGEELPELLLGNSWGAGWRNEGTQWITGRYAAAAYSVWYVSSVRGWA